MWLSIHMKAAIDKNYVFEDFFFLFGRKKITLLLQNNNSSDILQEFEIYAVTDWVIFINEMNK